MSSPPLDWLMATLMAYLDDGGDESLRAVSVAGYVGTVRGWGIFEPHWQAALDLHKIPYFHMNEIMDPKSPMHKFKGRDGAADLKALLIDLTKAIGKAWIPGLQGIAAVVPTEAIRRFNQDRGRKIDQIAFAIFHCLHMMRQLHPEQTIEAWLDQIDKADAQIARAKSYLATFPRTQGRDCIALGAAKGIVNVRKVRGMQAADLIAYEAYRSFGRMEPFFQSIDLSITRTPQEWAYDHEEWLEKSGLSHPNQRQSMLALHDATPVTSAIWTYEALCAQDDERNGKWG